MADAQHISFGQLLQTMAAGIADAQFALDLQSMEMAQLMSGAYQPKNPLTGEPELDPDTGQPRVIDTKIPFGWRYDEQGERIATYASYGELGFAPSFYQFVDNVVRVKLSLRLTTEGQAGSGNTPNYRLRGASVDATFANSYNFSAEFASTVETTIATVPPPVGLEELFAAQANPTPGEDGQ